jgi:hypothetical protein
MTRPIVMAMCVGLTALVVYGAGVAPELTPRSTLEQDLPFQVTDPVWLQQALPRVGGPESWWPSGLVARGWASLPSSWSLNLLSASLAATAAALLTFLMSGSTGALAGVVAGLGFALSPAVWAAAVAAEGDPGPTVLAVDLLIALTCAAAWWRTSHWAPLAGVVSALAVAVSQDLVAGLSAVVMFAFVTRGRGRGVTALGAAAAAVMVAVAYQVWAMEALVGPRVGDEGPSGVVEVGVAMWRWGLEPGATAGDMLRARVTAVGSVLMSNLGVLGCAVAALGLHRSTPQLAGLAAVTLAACGGPVPGVWDPITQALLPLAAAWGLVGFGIRRTASWRHAGGRPIALVLCVLLPSIQAVRTTVEAPRLIDRPAGQLLQAFVRQQDGPAVVVAEGARFGRLLVWANQRRNAAQRLDLVPHDPDRLVSRLAAGQPVYATETAGFRVSLSGFSGPPFQVYGRSLDEMLQSAGPRDLVGVAATPGAFEGNAEVERAVARLANNAEAFRVDEALVLVRRPADGVAHVASSPKGVDVPALPAEDGARLVADRASARLQVGELELASVASGAILATWSARDGSLDWSVVDRRHGLTGPWRHDRWALSRLGPHRDCALVSRREWSDVTRLATAARIGVELPRGGRLRLYVARDRGLFVRAAAFPGRASPDTTITSWDRSLADQSTAAAAALEADGLAPADWPTSARFLWQIVVAAPDAAPVLLALGLGGSPDLVRARLESSVGAGDATLCAGVAGARLFTREGLREDLLSLSDGDSFGDGWLAITRTDRGRWRQTVGDEAEVMVRVDVPETLTVAIAARPGPPDRQNRGGIGLRVNGVPSESHDLIPGDGTYAWTVPRDRWRVGTNHLVVTVAPTEPPSGVGEDQPVLEVTSIRFRR